VIDLLNSLYTQEWRFFHNFFCPSVKLISKERTGSKTIKRHDSPRTPYQRIMLSPFIESSIKNELSSQLENLNPFVLRKAIEIKLKKVFQLCYNNDHRRPTIDDLLR
jgi:hypothetical protein